MQQLTQGTLLHGGIYKIEKVLGQGSFGITYLAEHTKLAKKVAIKEFFMKELNSRSEDGSITGMSDGSLSQSYCQKFQKEADNLSRLDNQNIIRVTDSFSENGTFYYVMDYIDGQNLNDYVKTHYVDAEEAVSIIKSVADALIYMHEEKHMLHLDLKPSNVMRRSDGHVFLIDFGLSKHYGDDGLPETSTTIGLGTVGYAPIEQANRARNGEFRPTIDVYALGATLYKLLTRETPPPASDLVSDDELLENKLREKKVPDNLIKVVIGAMCPNVKKRIQSVRVFRDVLTGSRTLESASTKPSEETVVIKNNTKTTDGEETIVANRSTRNRKNSRNNNTRKYPNVKKKDDKESSNGDSKIIISIFVIAVVIVIGILGFRNCGGYYTTNHTAAPAAPADSDTVMVEDTTAYYSDNVPVEEPTQKEYTGTDVRVLIDMFLAESKGGSYFVNYGLFSENDALTAHGNVDVPDDRFGSFGVKYSGKLKIEDNYISTDYDKKCVIGLFGPRGGATMMLIDCGLIDDRLQDYFKNSIRNYTGGSLLSKYEEYPYNIYLYKCANGYILLDFNFGASTEFLSIYVSSDLSLLKDIMNEQRM